tara:strand:+ start:177 stop:2159 length:1983 start_codon:yes stop_codon:yes gene_type:complete
MINLSPLFLILLFFFSFVNSQSLELLPKKFLKEEKNKITSYLDSFKTSSNLDIFTSPPDFTVRTMAEWEEIQALTITWEGFEPILTEIVRNSVDECTVIIACDSPSQVNAYLQSNNVNTENVEYLDVNTNSIWMRDYAQNTVYSNDVDSIYLVDWIYNRPRPDDDAFPEVLSDYLGINLYQTSQAPYEIVSTGGNFMSDGFGTAFASNLILDENDGSGPYGGVNYPDHTEEEINNIMNEFMGITNYIKMEELPFDAIHHIDMHMKLLNEETLLVAEYPEGVSDGPQIEENLEYILDNFTTKYGTPFKVIRIPSPPSTSGAYPGSQPGNQTDGYYRTYTNSVFVNKTVLVPFYREEYDTIAQRIYEEALPGYNIVGIDCDNSGSNIISLSGAIHCITHSVGVNDPLLISFKQIEDVCLDEGIPYVTLSAFVKHKSGINSVNFNYRYAGESQFNSVSMQDNNVDNNWSVVMSFDELSDIEYYISAISNSGKQQVRPMTAPEGYYSFNYDYCQEIVQLDCNLSNGEIVLDGWSGFDNGLNYCNSCFCDNGVLSCTEIDCDPCGAEPEEGDCDGAFIRYYFNQETETCESFVWGGCEGIVPFETFEECQISCGDNSSILDSKNQQNKIIKIINILGQTQDKKARSSILLYLYEDGTVRKVQILN